MDEEAVREHAQGHIDALKAGDVGRALEDLSAQLRSQPGELMAMLPLPLTSGEIESVEMAGSGYTAVLHLVGETDETRLETRWKERDGRPTIVEVSHLSSGAVPVAEDARGRRGGLRAFALNFHRSQRAAGVNLGLRTARRALPREQPSAAGRAPRPRCPPLGRAQWLPPNGHDDQCHGPALVLAVHPPAGRDEPVDQDRPRRKTSSHCALPSTQSSAGSPMIRLRSLCPSTTLS